jgi:hypothetical protein
MRLKRVEKFSKPVTKGLLPTQQATICQIVCGILLCRNLLLAEIARCFETDVEFSHNLKRTFRFVDNQRLSDLTSKEVVARRSINQLLRRLQLKPLQWLEIIIDWTSVNGFQVLSALIPVAGRAVPILQMAVKKWQFKTSQNSFEDEFIQSLRRCISRTVKAVIVADRGFRRTDFLRFIEGLDLGYVIRVKSDVWIECAGYSGRLGDYPLSLGQTFKVSHVFYHKSKRYRLKLVFNCAKIKEKVSSWILATNLPLSAGQIINIYRRRFWCEESFRDQKQEFDLEGVRVKQARRLENLLLALAIVFLILAVIGMRGKKLGYADKFAVPRKKQTVISWVQIALCLLRKSTKYLNLLFDNEAGCFSYHWA